MHHRPSKLDELEAFISLTLFYSGSSLRFGHDLWQPLLFLHNRTQWMCTIQPYVLYVAGNGEPNRMNKMLAEEKLK